MAMYRLAVGAGVLSNLQKISLGIIRMLKMFIPIGFMCIERTVWQCEFKKIKTLKNTCPEIESCRYKTVKEGPNRFYNYTYFKKSPIATKHSKVQVTRIDSKKLSRFYFSPE